MTLDELLALLPDNTTGQIEAVDLRTIVTELYARAGTVGQRFSYLWVTSSGPGSGKATADAWSMAATTVQLSETTDDGEVLTFSTLDSAINPELWIITADGAKFHATITGPSVDQGGYRDLPITPLEVVGPVPSQSEKITVTVLVPVP